MFAPSRFADTKSTTHEAPLCANTHTHTRAHGSINSEALLDTHARIFPQHTTETRETMGTERAACRGQRDWTDRRSWIREENDGSQNGEIGQRKIPSNRLNRQTYVTTLDAVYDRACNSKRNANDVFDVRCARPYAWLVGKFEEEKKTCQSSSQHTVISTPLVISLSHFFFFVQFFHSKTRRTDDDDLIESNFPFMLNWVSD